LHLACGFGHKDIAKLLLDKQADVNIQNVRGGTPLHMACGNGHKDIVKLLLDKQADVNVETVGGFTPLYIACQKGHEEISTWIMPIDKTNGIDYFKSTVRSVYGVCARCDISLLWP
jgi:ankyrin repeat protein